MKSIHGALFDHLDSPDNPRVDEPKKRFKYGEHITPKKVYLFIDSKGDRRVRLTKPRGKTGFFVLKVTQVTSPKQ